MWISIFCISFAWGCIKRATCPSHIRSERPNRPVLARCLSISSDRFCFKTTRRGMAVGAPRLTTSLAEPSKLNRQPAVVSLMRWAWQARGYITIAVRWSKRDWNKTNSIQVVIVILYFKVVGNFVTFGKLTLTLFFCLYFYTPTSYVMTIQTLGQIDISYQYTQPNSCSCRCERNHSPPGRIVRPPLTYMV